MPRVKQAHGQTTVMSDRPKGDAESDLRREVLNPRVLTTTIKENVSAWRQQSELLPGWSEEVERTWKRRKAAPFYRDLLWGWRLFRASRRYDVVVTGFERAAIIFTFFQRTRRDGRRPHVLLDSFMNLSGPPLKRRLKRAFFRQIIGGTSRVVVFSRRQAQLYSEAFFFPEAMFPPIPYYPTVFGASYAATQGDYVFSGGDYTRDYATLIEAFRPLPYRLVIAAFSRDHFQGIDIPRNVKILTAAHEEFMRLIAGAGVVVVPLQGGLLRTGGHQTYLNAMSMGKAVIVADDVGADEYISNGQTGVVLKPGDPSTLRKAIVTLMQDRELASQMGEKAREATGQFSSDRFFSELAQVIEGCVRKVGRTEA